MGAMGGLEMREKVSLIRERPCALSILGRGLFGTSERSDGRTMVDPEEWLRECFVGEIFCCCCWLPSWPNSVVVLRGDILTGDEDLFAGEVGSILGDVGLRGNVAGAEKVGVINGETGAEL